MENIELKQNIEALLFIAGEPLPMRRMCDVFEGEEKSSIERALSELTETCETADRGVRVVQVAGGYQMVTKPECADAVKRLEKIKSPNRLSKSALEALAVIAYKQPVTRAEVEAIRGVDSSNVVRTLLERRIVKIVGRREGLGRPMLYGTTPEFLQYFGLKDLSELPALKEFKEISDTPTEFEPIEEPVTESVTQ
jgi:segregation and condensation protein B